MLLRTQRQDDADAKLGCAPTMICDRTILHWSHLLQVSRPVTLCSIVACVFCVVLRW